MKFAQLTAVATRAVASLFAQSLGTPQVDQDAGVIRDVAVMTAGEAKGWPFTIDQKTLQQTHALLAADPNGTRVRMKHPAIDPNTGQPTDGTGTTIGRLRNVRLVGNQIRGDVHLLGHAAVVPGQGNVRQYLLTHAIEDPAGIGLSAVIHYETENTPARPARVYQVDSVDFAEDPAANANGLLSAKPIQTPGVLPGRSPSSLSGGPMDPITQLLQSLGLDPSKMTADEISAAVAKLTPEQQAQAKAGGYTPGWAPTAAMSEGPELGPDGKPIDKPATPATMRAGSGTGAAALAAANLAAENHRCSHLRQVATLYRLQPEFAELHIGLGTDPAGFVTAARAELARRLGPTGGGQINVGNDRNVASLAAGISDGLRLRAGITIAQPHERSAEFRHLSLIETAKAYLSAIGIDHKLMGRSEVAKLVFDRGRMAALGRAQLAMSTGDFSSILQDTIGKTLRTSYEEAPSTWALWARRNTTSDFKTISRTSLSEAPDLDYVAPGGEYKDGKMSDAKETYALAKYGKIIALTWETMINDDLDAFGKIPQMMGLAAKRKEDDVVYYVLLANAAMADTGALFNATAVTTAGGHANLASSTGAPAKATLDAGVAAMALQKGPEGKATLNLEPQFLLHPPVLGGTVWELLNSTSYVAANTNSNVKNRYGPGGQVNLQPVKEARLQNGVTLNGSTANGSSTAWFLAAANGMIDTVEATFLSDEPAPVTEEKDGFRTDGREYKIRHCVAAKAIDWRGLYKNAG